MEKIRDLRFEKVNPTVNEADLWQKFKEGDKIALGTIFKLHYDTLFLYGIKIINQEEFIKDAIQDVFLRLWKTRETLGEVAVIKPYLLKCLRRHIVNENHKVERNSVYAEALKQEADATFSHEDFLINQHTTEINALKLAAAIQKLTRRQREIIFLKFTQGYTYEKIAEITEINLQSIRNLSCQAIKILKENLILLILAYSFLTL
jgi:RNA polymerase sigma factor (sigma-70 family)